MEYFYEEQVHRLEYLNHEPILFVDLLCQMNDLVKPKFEGHFEFEEIKAINTGVGIFFNCLVNLLRQTWKARAGRSLPQWTRQPTQ